MKKLILRKMHTSHDAVAKYTLRDRDGADVFCLNDCIGKQLTFQHTGGLFCIQCDRSVKKLFQQGYCYPCFQRLRECNLCIIHPERCLVMTDHRCSKDDWAHKHCHGEHVVYLSYTSNLKVGVTRHTNVPSRWIDQGAVSAVPIFRTDNRYLAGQMEVVLKQYVADKTNWRTMLKGSPAYHDLLQDKARLLQLAHADITALIEAYADLIQPVDEQPYAIQYPVDTYPTKVSSLSLEKTPEVSGLLVGLKAQYCIFEHGVMNVRKFSGYEVMLSCDESEAS